MEKLRQWQEKIDTLSLRERGAVFFCTLLVLYFLWDSIFMQPLQLTEKRVNSQLQQKQVEQLTLSTQIQQLDIRKKSEPDKEEKEKLKSLRLQLNEIEEHLQESTKNLIAPNEMAGMLEAVLLKIKGLKLLQIKGLGGTPIVQSKAPTVNDNVVGQSTTVNSSSSVVDNAYKHGLRIVFEGDYMSTIEYIQELENLGWGFFWESLDLEVKDYPDSVVSITVYTLSLDKNWIGV